MLIALLAHIIVFLGAAVLAALIVKLAVMTMKKMISLIKERLKSKIGGTVAIIEIKQVAKAAIEEAKRTNNLKNIAELEKMAEKEGIAIATQDANGNIDSNDISIYEADEMENHIYTAFDDEGILVIEA